MKILAPLLLLAPATAFAHPGHGTTEPESWTHYLTEPLHVLAFAALAATSFGVYRLVRRRRKQST